MTRNFKDFSLLPWQSTVLMWAGGTILVLLLIMIVMTFLRSKKKEPKEKLHTIFRCICLAFVIIVVIANAVGISFLVDAELGWKLSLLTGISVILGVISVVAMLIGAFSNMPTKIFWIWMFFAMLSFALVLNLVMLTLENK